MKYLNTLLENSEIDENVREGIVNSYKEVKEAFGKTGIVMDDNAEFVFSNHILALLKRIKANDFVEDIDEDMMSEVSKEAFEIAAKLVSGQFSKEALPVNRSEVFLVATHIEMAMQNKK